MPGSKDSETAKEPSEYEKKKMSIEETKRSLPVFPFKQDLIEAVREHQVINATYIYEQKCIGTYLAVRKFILWNVDITDFSRLGLSSYSPNTYLCIKDVFSKIEYHALVIFDFFVKDRMQDKFFRSIFKWYRTVGRYGIKELGYLLTCLFLQDLAFLFLKILIFV